MGRLSVTKFKSVRTEKKQREKMIRNVNHSGEIRPRKDFFFFFLNQEANSKTFDIKSDFLATYLRFFLGMQITSCISKPSLWVTEWHTSHTEAYFWSACYSSIMMAPPGWGRGGATPQTTPPPQEPRPSLVWPGDPAALVRPTCESQGS